MIKRRLRFVTDPAHGWLEVPRADVEAVGYHPSPQSYFDATTEFYYLEEDVDVFAWLKLAKPAGDFRDVHSNYPSFVRNLRPIRDPEYINPFVRS